MNQKLQMTDLGWNWHVHLSDLLRRGVCVCVCVCVFVVGSQDSALQDGKALATLLFMTYDTVRRMKVRIIL